jgi:hypothetical protein
MIIYQSARTSTTPTPVELVVSSRVTLAVTVTLYETELRCGAEPALPEMAGQFEPGMDAGAVSAMGFGKGRPQAALLAGRHDEVNRVGHEAPGPDLCARGLGGLADQVEIGSLVAVIEDDRLPVIASLGDVVRQAWDNDARKSGHRWSSAG